MIDKDIYNKCADMKVSYQHDSHAVAETFLHVHVWHSIVQNRLSKDRFTALFLEAFVGPQTLEVRHSLKLYFITLSF